MSHEKTLSSLTTVPLISKSAAKTAYLDVAQSFLSGLAQIMFRSERQRQRRALTRLDVRLLQDFGVTRSQAREESSKWFWQD
jgi:uncharacterized protein YjiS (DUF1127 family)